MKRAVVLLAVLATGGCAVIHRAGSNFWELERKLPMPGRLGPS